MTGKFYQQLFPFAYVNKVLEETAIKPQGIIQIGKQKKSLTGDWQEGMKQLKLLAAAKKLKIISKSKRCN